jgi:uncharacterized Tic20 family protein
VKGKLPLCIWDYTSSKCIMDVEMKIETNYVLVITMSVVVGIIMLIMGVVLVIIVVLKKSNPKNNRH